ncbi:MAG TPA: YwiC-like family protein [Opitutus sp.]|nr:YwiC-like family protein [Opitutus sp.]
MSSVAVPTSPRAIRVRVRDVLLPKEHGSWSLALEPVALGLLVAPSRAGAYLSVAVIAGFFARRPLKLVWREKQPERRRAAALGLAWCGAIALAAGSLALATAGVELALWLLPFAIAGAAFLFFDLRNDGREEFAEIVGAAAFASIAAALAVAAGASHIAALAILVAMAGRAVPSVMYVRARVRGAKTGDYRVAPALTAALGAVLLASALWFWGWAPLVVPLALLALLIRATAGLFRREPVRGRILGMQEAVLGLAYVSLLAAVWRG